MGATNWIQYITAFGSIATPLLVLTLTAIGWRYKQSIERKLKLEEKLRDDRVEIYNKILEPFSIFLMSDAAWESDKRNKGKDKNEIATNQMLTIEYRKDSFKLSLMGSDEVVIAFNNLMQYFFSQKNHQGETSDDQLKSMLALLGDFLLEIRRSTGNEHTKIDNWGMLEWFMTDARQMRNGTYRRN